MLRVMLGIALASILSACSGPSPALPAGGGGQAAAEPASAPAEPAAPTPPPVSTPATVPLPGFQVSTIGWRTDFSKRSVPGNEIVSGGPPRDGIPPIDRPKFISPTEAASWLKDSEPVVVFEEQGEARAYPLQILIWHEIVNDEVAGRPVVVTFCPLCNTAIAFDRRLDGRVLDFGTTGNLRFSDLVMWDRQTESWWQQITGEAIVGELTGQKLRPLPAGIVSSAEFKDGFPNGLVLSRETGYQRSYGRNPYVGYDDINSSPFLFSGQTDGRLRPMERVVTVSLGGEDAAYPFSLLEQRRVVQDRVGGRPIVIFFARGTTSALDASSIPDSRDIGSTGVFEPSLDGRSLSFKADGDRIVDGETGSTWNVLGQATTGPLAGKRLAPIVSGNHFWFAWVIFRPQTRIWKPE
jgi:hypothetical protein